MSYLASDSQVQGQQLKVQQLVVRFADLGLYTISTNDVIVQLGQAASVFSVIHNDNSGPTAILIAASGVVVSGTQVTVTLAAPFAANDSLVINFIVTE